MYRLSVSVLLAICALTMGAPLYAETKIAANDDVPEYVALPDSGKAYIHYYGYPRSLYLSVLGAGVYHVAINRLDRRTLDFTDSYYAHLYYLIINKKRPIQFKVVHRFRSKKMDKPIASVNLFYGKFDVNKSISKVATVRYLPKDRGIYPTKWATTRMFQLYSTQWYKKSKNRDQYRVWIHRPGTSWD